MAWFFPWVLLCFLSGFEQTSTNTETCKASVFAQKGDKWAGGRSPFLRRKVRHTDWGVAHRTHPLGSWVTITNLRTRKTVQAQVIDRGPYGAVHQGKWRLKKRKTDPGKWRGCLDMTPPIAKELGHNGFELVRVVGAPRRSRMVAFLPSSELFGMVL